MRNKRWQLGRVILSSTLSLSSFTLSFSLHSRWALSLLHPTAFFNTKQSLCPYFSSSNAQEEGQKSKKKKKREANFSTATATAIAMELSSDRSLSLKPNPDDDDDNNPLTQLTPEATSKKRKVLQKTVVTVKIGSKKAAVGLGKMKNEGPPPDFWSWRKYGQKPIKGSPYPRGYYRCSTTKGCSAKKQVERCKTDGSKFIITYTSSHNHPGPNISTLNLEQTQEEIQPQPLDQDQNQDIHLNQGLEKQDQSDEEEEEEEEEEGLLLGMEEEEEKPMEKIRECLEEPISSCSHKLINLSATNKTEVENHDHFFDELEELPSPPPFSSYFFDEIRIISAAPS